MRPALPASIFAGIALLAPAVAQPVAERSDIPVEEWTAMAEGRTLVYRIDGDFWAMEHYYPGSNRLTLLLNDGSCQQGHWAYEAPRYCFFWERDGTACFRHIRQGDDILIIPVVDGVETGEIQMMTEVTDTPLHCGPPPTS